MEYQDYIEYVESGKNQEIKLGDFDPAKWCEEHPEELPF